MDIKYPVEACIPENEAGRYQQKGEINKLELVPEVAHMGIGAFFRPTG